MIRIALVAAAITLGASPAAARPARTRTPAVAPTPPAAPVAPVAPIAPVAPGIADAPLAPAPPAPPRIAVPGDAPLPPSAHMFSIHTGGPRLGVTATGMTDELRKFFGARAGAGILVQGVATGTPAAKAGVQVGDVIVTVDGDPIDHVGDVAAALADRRDGDDVEIEVIRAKKSRRLIAEVDVEDGPRWSGGRFHIEGLPPEALHLFEGGDADLRRGLEALDERLQQLERRLDRGVAPRKAEPKRPVPPKRAPRRSARPASDHT